MAPPAMPPAAALIRARATSDDGAYRVWARDAGSASEALFWFPDSAPAAWPLRPFASEVCWWRAEEPRLLTPWGPDASVREAARIQVLFASPTLPCSRFTCADLARVDACHLPPCGACLFAPVLAFPGAAHALPCESAFLRAFAPRFGLGYGFNTH